jgi:hypothetical protein
MNERKIPSVRSTPEVGSQRKIRSRYATRKYQSEASDGELAADGDSNARLALHTNHEAISKYAASPSFETRSRF